MKFFTHNIIFKLMALVGALGLWVYVVGTSSLIYSFPEALPIEFFNRAENAVIVNNQERTVSIKVKAPKNMWNEIEPEEFQAYVDLKGLVPGEVHSVDVIVSSDNSDVSVFSVTPKRIEVLLDTVVEKEFPISLTIDGDIGENYTVEDPLLSQELVMVAGAETKIDTISSVQANVVLSENETGEVKRSVSLKPVREDGEEVEELTIEPATVDVTIPVKEIKKSKTIGITPTYDASELPEGYWVKSITVTPQTVEVLGDASVLNTLELVSTEEIDLSSIDQDTEMRATLRIPENVTLADPTQRFVTVRISVTDDQAQRRLQINVTINDVPDNYEIVSIEPETVEIVLRGSEESFENVDTSLIIAAIDGTALELDQNYVEIFENNILLPDAALELTEVVNKEVLVTVNEKNVDSE